MSAGVAILPHQRRELMFPARNFAPAIGEGRPYPDAA